MKLFATFLTLVLATGELTIVGAPVPGTHKLSKVKITNTAELTEYIRSFKLNSPLIEKVLATTSEPRIDRTIDELLRRWPEAPNIIQGIGSFLSSPDGRPLREVFLKVMNPVKEILFELSASLMTILEDAGEALTEQGIRLFFSMQDPTVIDSIKKLQATPEIQILGVYLQEYDIELDVVFKKLLETLSSLPTPQHS